jgi:hypothetical protein
MPIGVRTPLNNTGGGAAVTAASGSSRSVRIRASRVPTGTLALRSTRICSIVPAHSRLHNEGDGSVIRGTFLKGVGLAILWPEFLAMAMDYIDEIVDGAKRDA